MMHPLLLLLLLTPLSPPFGSTHSHIIGVFAAVAFRIYSQGDPSHSNMQPDLQVNSLAPASLLPPHTLLTARIVWWGEPFFFLSPCSGSRTGRGPASRPESASGCEGRRDDGVNRQQCGRKGELSPGFILFVLFWLPQKWSNPGCSLFMEADNMFGWNTRSLTTWNTSPFIHNHFSTFHTVYHSLWLVAAVLMFSQL